MSHCPELAPQSSCGDGGSKIRILQFTDMHISAAHNALMKGVDPRATLAALLKFAYVEERQVRALFFTGDLSHDGTERSYIVLREMLSQVPWPMYCIPGNHDDTVMMERILAPLGVLCCGEIALGAWRVILLNTRVPGEVHGHLNHAELARLEAFLGSGEEPVIVALHHQPMKIGSAWMDALSLDNPDEFFAVLDHSDRVRAVLWGHIHQSFDALRGGVRMLGAPSTCVQFRSLCAESTIDDLGPGYRWLDLYSDGRLETGIKRIDAL